MPDKLLDVAIPHEVLEEWIRSYGVEYLDESTVVLTEEVNLRSIHIDPSTEPPCLIARLEGDELVATPEGYAVYRGNICRGD